MFIGKVMFFDGNCLKLALIIMTLRCRGNSLKDPASKAYAQVFAPHHGWAIRKAVAAGMYALPTKAQLLKKLNEDGKFVCFIFGNSIS